VNAAFADAAAAPPLEGILAYSEAALVSTDILRSPYSCVFDSQLTMTRERLVQVFGWYDNELGYSCRSVDLVERLH
jgi:glyceraldehyde 3-phosphate dehydrogenase